MSLTLTVGGTNFLPQYKTNSAEIVERIASKLNTLRLQIIKKSGENIPQEGQEIIFKDGARYLFGGFITKISPQEIGEGEMFIYSIEASSYEILMVNKYAQKIYKDKTLEYIVEDLLSTYVDSGYGITDTNVITGPTIDSIAFNHISLRKCFEKLEELTGYIWWIDYEKNFYFKAKYHTPASEQITDSSANFSSISILYDTSQVKNSIVVRGGFEETSAYYQQSIECDGVAREWLLREKPTDVEYIKLNTVSKTFGEDPEEEEAGLDFMYNAIEKYIREVSGSLTGNGDTIEISYKYDVPVIVKLKSAAGIAAMKAIEGGDGIHDFMIVSNSIKSKDEARARALQELDDFSEPILNGTFFTRTNLLSGTIFAPGQVLTVNLPTWNINVDTDYLIREVIIKPLEAVEGIEYAYEVVFGGKMFGISDLISKLSSKEEYIFGSKEIDRIEAISERLGIEEIITRDQNAQSVQEDVGIEEAITRNNITPPFEYGPAGVPQGVWNSAEWG